MTFIRDGRPARHVTRVSSPDGEDSERIYLPARERGRVWMGPDVISPDALQDLADLARQIKGGGSIHPRKMQRIIREVREKGTIARPDLKELQTLARGMRAWHRDLHVQYRKSDYTDRQADGELQKVHQFLHQWDKAKTRFNIAQRVDTLHRMAPQIKPDSVLGSYFVHSGSSKGEMEALLHIAGNLATGRGNLFRGGNRLSPLLRDQIWQKKMTMLADAIVAARNGHPTEIDVQYYELTSATMLSRLVEAGKAGCKVRVNMDPGRLFNARDGSFEGSEIPRKLLSLMRLMDHAHEADIAVTLYPADKELGRGNLMHRKVFRVGDQVILGGMNANSSSGENIDAAVLVEGPAARRMMEILKRDVKTSVARTLTEVYNAKELAKMKEEPVFIGPTGLLSLLEAAAGSEYRSLGKSSRMPLNASLLEEMASTQGIKLNQIVESMDADELNDFLNGGDTHGNLVKLKPQGVQLLQTQMEKAVALTSTAQNQTRAQDISLPSDAVKGNDTLALGDRPLERTAIVLQAIATAEKFIYLPTFVLTKVVAKALVARKNELAAQGKDLDIRCVIDSGLYPDGGTPNETGYMELENAGIPVRWAALVRPDHKHARKIHAKCIITDKMALVGSTNMSTKALRDNWELSGLVMWNDEHPHDKLTFVEDFLKTWDEESIAIDTRALAEKRLAGLNRPDLGVRHEEARHSIIMETLRGLENYEKESTDVLRGLVEMHHLEEPVEQKLRQGLTAGYAILTTLEEHLGRPTVETALHNTRGWQALERLQTTGWLRGDKKPDKVAEPEVAPAMAELKAEPSNENGYLYYSRV